MPNHTPPMTITIKMIKNTLLRFFGSVSTFSVLLFISCLEGISSFSDSIKMYLPLLKIIDCSLIFLPSAKVCYKPKARLLLQQQDLFLIEVKTRLRPKVLSYSLKHCHIYFL